MKRLTILTAVAIATAGVGSVAFSQDSGRNEMSGMMSRMQGQGMMQGCPMMANRGASQSQLSLVPQLPPGNEKLQAQMNAEILQKIGEIAAKYAGQAK